MTEHDRSFLRLVSAVTPWLPQLVVVGGWAHRLHREHQLATVPTHAPVRTRDADLAFGAETKLRGRLSEALRAAGFHEELSSDESPPTAQYHLGADDGGFYAEFITPLRGDGTRSRGNPNVTEIRGGIVAQKLRHVEVLLISPWRIPVGGPGSEEVGSPRDVLVANPVSFVVQKLLIHDLRPTGKQAHDILYIHDTIQLFGGSLEALRSLWREHVRDGLTTKQRKTLRDRVGIFAQVTDVLRNAARIPTDRALRAEEVRAVCEYGLGVVLSSH